MDQPPSIPILTSTMDWSFLESDPLLSPEVQALRPIIDTEIVYASIAHVFRNNGNHDFKHVKSAILNFHCLSDRTDVLNQILHTITLTLDLQLDSQHVHEMDCILKRFKITTERYTTFITHWQSLLEQNNLQPILHTLFLVLTEMKYTVLSKIKRYFGFFANIGLIRNPVKWNVHWDLSYIRAHGIDVVLFRKLHRSQKLYLIQQYLPCFDESLKKELHQDPDVQSIFDKETAIENITLQLKSIQNTLAYLTTPKYTDLEFKIALNSFKSISNVDTARMSQISIDAFLQQHAAHLTSNQATATFRAIFMELNQYPDTADVVSTVRATKLFFDDILLTQQDQNIITSMIHNLGVNFPHGDALRHQDLLDLAKTPWGRHTYRSSEDLQQLQQKLTDQLTKLTT